MNADLIDGLARVADSSEKMPHLRRLVVALAISGKLDASGDEESFTLMRERLKGKRERLVQMGKLKRQGELPSVSSEELPFEISNACHFERLGNLAMLAKGLTGIQSADPGPFPLVVTAEDRSSCDHFDFEGAAAIIPMVSSTGHGHASLNRLHYQEGKFALGNILCAAFPISEDLISARFLYEYLTAFKEELLVSKMIGTANVSLTIGKIGEVPVPIVSPTVQRQVDELLALCDRLEAAQAERESRRDRLVASSLHRLNNGADPVAFRGHARFYFNHLPRLTARLEHIQQLRQTILNLGVRGKLVPQDPKDEAAEALLQRVDSEREQLVKAKRIRRQDYLGPIIQDEIPFTIPEGWQWRYLADVCFVITDGAHHTPQYLESGVPFLSVKDVSSGTIDFSSTRYISEEAHRELSKRCRPERGDILLTKVGTTGIAVTIDDGREFSIFVSLALLKFSQANLNSQYLKHLINSPFVRQQSSDNTQGIGNKNLVLRLINQFTIPIPPLAEQHRIVAKVEELMALCDRLEAQLTTTHTESSRLLEAVLHKALTA